MAPKASISNIPIEEEYPGEMLYQILGPNAALQGWPGYRHRPGRIGLDPLDTDYELAHVEGVVIRQILIGEVFTTNPIYLFFMAFYGFFGAFPLAASLIELIMGEPSYFGMTLFLLPYEILGVLLLRNVVLSIIWKNTINQKTTSYPVII